ncbi:MAG: peptide chain release factor N(5)-glutamine methyltransferase, partial [Spirochaetales bacterium]|nr:peptide chain release factor N(5)-glutamine methyltransferase [Candidatus Physcosoma equi]
MKLFELKALLIQKGASLEMPALEARLLLEHAGYSVIKQITDNQAEVEETKVLQALSEMEKRVSGYPMAYILGEKEFWGLTFHVDERVLIPRPDTETLVETALSLAKEADGRILDLCTGSGAIATALAHSLKRPVAMSDLSEDALTVARENYIRLIGEEPDARQGDLLSPWKGERFSLIVSNPPYLTDGWYEIVDEDVKKEPKTAFIGFGEDGLDLIRQIVEDAPAHLETNGYLAFECDYRQCQELSLLLAQKGFTGVNIVQDLSGTARVVYGTYSESPARCPKAPSLWDNGRAI